MVTVMTTKGNLSRRTKAPNSPVKLARGIPKPTQLLLAVRAGGRCQFKGCNEFLYENKLTRKTGNFSEQAHIVAFSLDGPRGRTRQRPRDPHDIANLMLLCPGCHKEIDTRPIEYPQSLLEKFKSDHEERINHLTSLGPEQRSTVVQLKSRIFGHAVDIPTPHVYSAISPRYPSDSKGHVIDLTRIKDDNIEQYYDLAKREIAREVASLYEPGMSADDTKHISIFALAQIPLLMHLGRCLSNKIETEFYQRHRTESDPWKWPEDGPAVFYSAEQLQSGTNSQNVALVLSLSGPIALTALPAHIDDTFTIYEIRPISVKPGTDFLRKRSDLQEFRRQYRALLASIRGEHPNVAAVHVFPAAPAPIAITCGHDLLPKVDPALIVYDFVKTQGGFIRRIAVNEHDSK